MQKLIQTFREDLDTVRQDLENIQNLKGTFLTLILIYVTALSALIRANAPYLDDNARTIWGYRGFNYSRVLSDALSPILHINTQIMDISPFTMLLAVVGICAASVVLLVIFSEKEKLSFWDIAAVLPLGLSPYYLECFSYKFDAPYMALSVLASILPLLLYKAHWLLYCAGVLLGTLAMCTTYQTSSGIFPMAVIFLVCKLWRDGTSMKEVLLFALKSAAAYLAGLMIFKVFIMGYSDLHYVDSSMLPLMEMPGGALRNLKGFYKQVLLDFEPEWLLCVLVIGAGFVGYSAYHSRQRKLLTFFLSGFAAVLAAVLTFGIYLVTAQPMFAFRSMYGFGAWIALAAVSTVAMKKTLPVKLTCLGLGWCFFIFTLIYGNAIGEQQNYVRFRSQTLAQELSRIEILQEEPEILFQLTGDAGDSPVLTEQLKYMPQLGRLVQSGFAGNGWMWNSFYFYHYLDLEDTLIETTGLETENLPLISSSYYQDIYGEGNKILVVLKDHGEALRDATFPE